jgi:predicted transcriptional regulator
MSEVKDQTKTLIDELSDSDVEALMQIIQRLAEWEATQEVLNSPELMKGIQEGLKDIEAGRIVNWRDVKPDAPNDG